MQRKSESAGALYVVATPIGNLSDISQRAIDTLSECDTLACEDTRVTTKLLQHLQLQKPLLSYREENEKKQTPLLIKQLQEGKNIALVSDAGTPTLSDPGFRIIRECRRQGVPVAPIPGPTAFATALSASGLPTNAFLFVGFLPNKSAARKHFFKEHIEFPHTVIFYESSHRIEKCLDNLLEVVGGDRTVCIAREITKRYETFLVGKLNDVLDTFSTSSKKGEFVVILAPQKFEL